MGIRCVDLSTGLGGAAAARLLADVGATLLRVRQPSDDYFLARIPGYADLRADADIVGVASLPASLELADVVLVGGEPSPEHGTTAPDPCWSDLNPHAVVVDLGRTLSDGVTPAVEALAQAATGLSNEQFSDRPLWFGVPMASYGQAILAAYGALAALVERARGGTAPVVRPWLDHGAAYFMGPFVLGAERPDPEFDKVTPKDTKHLLFPCRDGGYVQFAMGVPGAVKKLYEILEIDEVVDPNDRGFPKPAAPAATFFGNRPLIEKHTVKFDREVILARAKEAHLPAAPILAAGEFLTHPQVAANGLLRESGTGSHLAGYVRLLPGESCSGAEPQRCDRVGPLSGYRVLDFGTFVAGPFTGRLLEDLGADVIKVESLDGDPGRGTMRHFLLCQSGKRSVSVDLKSEQGAEIARRLLESADIAMHNFRVGVDERLGLAPEQSHKVNPKLITLASLAFGVEGPLAKEPGFDMIAQALVGLERRAGGDGGEPIWYRTPYLDYAVGGLGAIAVLAAVHDRITRGTVSSGWVSLLNAGLFMVSDFRLVADGVAEGPAPVAPDGLGLSPWERYYRTRDGWIAVSAPSAGMAARLTETVLGRGGVPGEDAAAQRALADVFSTRPTAGWSEQLAGAGVWSAPVRDAELPHAQRADMTYGRIRGHLTTLVELVGLARSPVRPGAPTLGHHTREVLGELGFSDEEIDALEEGRVIRADRRNGAKGD